MQRGMPCLRNRLINWASGCSVYAAGHGYLISQSYDGCGVGALGAARGPNLHVAARASPPSSAPSHPQRYLLPRAEWLRLASAAPRSSTVENGLSLLPQMSLSDESNGMCSPRSESGQSKGNEMVGRDELTEEAWGAIAPSHGIFTRRHEA